MLDTSPGLNWRTRKRLQAFLCLGQPLSFRQISIQDLRLNAIAVVE
jgi:hypothetical protein